MLNLWQWLSETICRHKICGDIANSYGPSVDLFPYGAKLDKYVLRTVIVLGVVCRFNSTLVITFELGRRCERFADFLV